MIWKLFGSKNNVETALAQSVGYDISPNIIAHTPPNVFQLPANEARPIDVSSQNDLRQKKNA